MKKLILLPILFLFLSSFGQKPVHDLKYNIGNINDTYGLTGTVTGSTLKQDKKGNALETGQSKYVQYSGSLLPAGALSCVVWAKLRPSHITGTNIGTSISSATTGTGLNISSTTSGYPLIYLSSTNLRSFTYVPDKNWHCYIFTIPGAGQTDINNSQLYVDGLFRAVNATTASGAQDARSGFVYTGGGNSATSGSLISRIKVYDVVLNQQQVDKEYQEFLASVPISYPTYNFTYPVSQEINDQGLIYAFNGQKNGTVVQDVSGNGNVGTVSDLKLGQVLQTKDGLQFNGINGKVAITGSNGLAGDVTMESIVNINSVTGNQRIFDNGYCTLALTVTTGVITASRNGGTTNASATNTSSILNNWIHILCTSTSAGSTSIYINGSLSGSAGQAAGTPTTSTSWMVGNNAAANRSLSGNLSSFKIYNRILSATEIANHYQQFANRPVLKEEWKNVAVRNNPSYTGGSGFVSTELSSSYISDFTLNAGYRYIVSSASQTAVNGLLPTSTLSIPIGLNQTGELSFDLWNGYIWNRYSGSLTDLSTNNQIVSYSSGKLMFTIQGGHALGAVTLTKGEKTAKGDYYGVSFDVTASSSTMTRTGNMTSHSTFPIQSLMLPCIVSDAGVVQYYLDPTNVTLKATGGAAKLDGTDGQSMVEIPQFYWKWVQSGNISEIRVSKNYIKGYVKSPKFYHGMYKAALQRSTLKLSSVVNTTADYRGGNNSTAQQLGMPATAISRTNFRTYASNRNAKCHQRLWEEASAMWMLYLIEYANRNCQAAVPTGLGAGVTTINGTDWGTFNGYYPLIPCGSSNSISTPSGEVSYSIPGFPGSTGTPKVNRYRFIEDPFGDIWEWVDGINIYHQTTVEGGKSILYVIPNKANLTDVVNGDNMLETKNLARSEGYIKIMIGGMLGILQSKDNNGGSTTYWCDYNYLNVTSNAGLRAPILSGDASYGAYAGFGFVYSHIGASVTTPGVGARLCIGP